MIPAISLCSSAGFMDEAFFLEGFSIRAQVEIDPWRRQVLARRFPRAKQFEDVFNVGRHNLPANPTIIFGGFPCTPVSGAGRRKGTADERWLWPEFARIIGELRPRVVFLENADEIGAPIKSDGAIIAPGPGLEVIASLTALGYDARWGIVSAASAGAPHQRDRWWCVAWRISDTSQDQCGTGIVIDEQSGRSLANNAGWDDANTHKIGWGRQQTAAVPGPDCSGSQRDTALQSTERSAVVYAAESSDQDVAQGDTLQERLASQSWTEIGNGAEVTRNNGAGVALRHTSSPRLEGQAGQQLEASAQSQQGLGCEQVESAYEPNLGGIVFDGIARRLERLASAQLYAAPLGLQPYPFEPVRLTDDDYDWKARVEAIGDAVCIPVVRAFAAGIREGLWAQDAAIRERRGKKEQS